MKLSNALNKSKIWNYLLSIQHAAEKLPDSQEIEWGNRAVMDALDKIFNEIDSGRLNE